MGAAISYRNFADAATVTVNSPGSFDASFPASNMKTRTLSVVAKINGVTNGVTGSFTLIVDLGANYASIPRPTLFGLFGTNLAFVPAYGARASSISAAYSNNPAGPFSALPGTGTTVTDNADMEFPGANITIASAVAPVAARYYRLNCLISTADAFVQIGRLWVGDTLKAPSGIDAGWSMSVVDPGRLDTSYGGQVYADKRTRLRKLSMSFVVQTPQAFGFDDGAALADNIPSMQGLQLYCGSTGELVAIPRADDPLYIRRTGLYGHLESPFDIRHLAGANYAVAMDVIEER